jgi:hypothetical protein
MIKALKTTISGALIMNNQELTMALPRVTKSDNLKRFYCRAIRSEEKIHAL